MTFVSITRLRVRTIRYLPAFALPAHRSIRQVRLADGFLGGALLPDRGWTFWTMTAWEVEANLRAYMLAGAHRLAMPHLIEWCDQASLVHWDQGDSELPSWPLAHQRLCAEGRASNIRHPSPRHSDLSFDAPRTRATVQIRPAARRS